LISAERSHENLFEELARALSWFAKDDSVITTTHYGLIVAGTTIAVIAVVPDPGAQLNTTFNSVSLELEGQQTLASRRRRRGALLSKRDVAPAFRLCMVFPENRHPLFQIVLRDRSRCKDIRGASSGLPGR
jgi:Flp pilus assembly pilin Flp